MRLIVHLPKDSGGIKAKQVDWMENFFQDNFSNKAWPILMREPVITPSASLNPFGTKTKILMMPQKKRSL